MRARTSARTWSGAGGVMLPNHAPLVIAEQFGTLATLYPGRIDLGLGRAPGTDRLTMQALRRNLEVARRNRFPLLVIGDDNVAQPIPKVLEVPDNGKNGHEFGAYGNPEFGLHREPILLAPQADNNVSQRLGAKIHNPAHFHIRWINVEPLQFPLRQFRIVIVPFVLHPGRQGDHGQVMGIHDVIDVSGKT